MKMYLCCLYNTYKWLLWHFGGFVALVTASVAKSYNSDLTLAREPSLDPARALPSEPAKKDSPSGLPTTLISAVWNTDHTGLAPMETPPKGVLPSGHLQEKAT